MCDKLVNGVVEYLDKLIKWLDEFDDQSAKEWFIFAALVLGMVIGVVIFGTIFAIIGLLTGIYYGIRALIDKFKK